MTTLIADIEADGFYDTVSVIHCIVTKDKETGDVKKFCDLDIPGVRCDGTIRQGVDFLLSANTVVGHNWIDYDARVIKKFYPDFVIDVHKIRDTYIRSLMFDPHRERDFKCPVSKLTPSGRQVIGAHSLENWGYLVGRGKVENEDWTKLTAHMIHRCVEDVEITDLVDDALIKEAGDWDWSLSEWIEKRFRQILSEQEGYGWLFNMDKAKHCIEDLGKKIQEIDDEVLPRIPKRMVTDGKTYKQIRKKDGGYHTNFIKWFESSSIGEEFSMSSFCGDHCRISYETINLASESQVKEYLLSVGWEPTEWNYKKDGKRFAKDADGKQIPTSPKLTEDSFESLFDDTGKLVAKRITLCHRRSQIQGWIDAVRPDGRIGAGGNSVGTNTGRVTHRLVVNVPKAEEDVFYGKEMRSLFTVPAGKRLVGADLTALEDRLAGHHTFKYDGGEYAKELLEDDPHQKTADLFGCSRFKGKTSNHALKYGAQFPKLASIVGCSDEKAKKLWFLWWDSHPSLKAFKNVIERALTKRGFLKGNRLAKGAFIKGIDGRKIFLRSAHSALNARIQNAGSVVNKLTTIYIQDGIDSNWLDAHFVGNFHDESQAEVAEDDVETYKKVVQEAVVKVNDFFKFSIPMGIEAKVGKTWSDTH